MNESTANFGLRLINRVAPSPTEKEIIESLPFVQGVYDFSTILGERVFENRDITYQFRLFERDYSNRKIIEVKLKQWLLKNSINQLYDTHSTGYYWLGKFSSVTVEDDNKASSLILTAIFNCYPLMISTLSEGSDIWDYFNFELDVAQTVEFEIVRRRTINLLNTGASSVVPTITASSNMVIIKEDVTYTIPHGTTKNDLFRLKTGENIMRIQGNGKIKFTFHKEVLG